LEEEEGGESSSLFIVPPNHDDVLQVLQFATSSVTTSTTYSGWDLEETDIDGDDEVILFFTRYPVSLKKRSIFIIQCLFFLYFMFKNNYT